MVAHCCSGGWIDGCSQLATHMRATHQADAHLKCPSAGSACSDTQHSPAQVHHRTCAPHYVMHPIMSCTPLCHAPHYVMHPIMSCTPLCHAHAPTTLTLSSVCTACLYSGSAWARGEAGRGGSGPSTKLTGSSGAGWGALNMLMATSLCAMYCAPPSKPAAQQQAEP
jgi:hypothetical protein